MKGYTDGRRTWREIATSAQAEKQQLTTEMRQLELDRVKLIAEWNARVAEKERLYAELEAQQKLAATEIQRRTREDMERILRENKKLKDSIQRYTPLGSTVCAPDSLRLHHDAAVGGPGSPGYSPDNPPPDPGGATGKTETFDAVAVTERLVENIQRYNELAAKYNALLDFSLKMQEIANSNSLLIRGQE